MNERINELLKQSRTEYWTQYTPSYDHEKFAELLVKECAYYVDSAISDGGVDGRSLKEYFGVK